GSGGGGGEPGRTGAGSGSPRSDHRTDPPLRGGTRDGFGGRGRRGAQPLPVLRRPRRRSDPRPRAGEVYGDVLRSVCRRPARPGGGARDGLGPGENGAGALVTRWW